jgi:RNA polymerase sigma-70 factor, ECF subfamily
MDGVAGAVDAAGLEGALAPAETLAFEDFFQDTHERLFAALCLVTADRHEAEEIMQDAYLRVWERWDRVAGMDEPTGFLFRTAMNLFRKRYRRARLAARHALSRESTTRDAFATIDDRDALVRGLRTLTPHQRAAVVLTAILGYSSSEAGQMLGVSDSTIRVMTTRARSAMREIVGDGGDTT